MSSTTIESTAAAPEVNWRVVSFMYASGLALCALMASLQYAGVSSAEGLWIIFSPFAPCLLYALRRHRQQTFSSEQKGKID